MDVAVKVLVTPMIEEEDDSMAKIEAHICEVRGARGEGQGGEERRRLRQGFLALSTYSTRMEFLL